MKKITSSIITAIVFVLSFIGLSSAETSTGESCWHIGKGIVKDQGKHKNLEPNIKTQDLSGKIENLDQDKLTDLERAEK